MKVDAVGVSYIIVSIFKFIFTLINLMSIISDINMWLWQWLKFMYYQQWSLNQWWGNFLFIFMMPTLLFSNHFMCAPYVLKYNDMIIIPPPNEVGAGGILDSPCPSVPPSVPPSHLFDYVPIIVSSWNFQELLLKAEVMSMQKVKVKG